MAHALVLTASSSGRTSLPSDAGFSLDVDGDAPVTLDVWPYPSTWIPDGVRLYRHGREVAASPTGEELRWVFTGDDRFGEFSALAIAAGRAVTSPLLVVRPAGAATDSRGPARTRSAAATVGGLAGPAAADQPAAPHPLDRAPGEHGRGPSDDLLIDLSAGRGPDAAPWSPAGPTRASGADGPGPLAEPAPRAPGVVAGPWGAAPAQGAPTAQPTPQSAISPAIWPAVPAAAPPASPPDAATPALPPAPPDAATPALPPTPPGAAPPHATTAVGRIPAHASPDDLRALAEVPAREYDGRFAAVVGILFAVLAGGFAALVLSRLLIDVNPPIPAPADTAAPISHDGTVAERVGLASSVLLIALGGVLLLAGAALAALEVRGRQRHSDTAPAAWRAQEPGLRFIPAMLDRLNQVPAVVAVLVVGGIVLGLGLIGTLYWPTLF